MEWYFVLLIVLAVVLVVLLGLFIFLIKPGSDKKVWNYDWLVKTPIAHRGYHLDNGEVPENSSIGFERAIERGYNIEIDLNLTKDNKIVVFHDGNVWRMCDKLDRKIHDMTLEELQKLPLKGGQYHMMELSEFLNLVNGSVGVLVEYKSEGPEIDKILCEESMKLFKDYKGNWVMQSFQPRILQWFKKNYPDIPRGQLCHDYRVTKEEKAKKKGQKKTKGETSATARWFFTYMMTDFVGRPNFISRCHTSMPWVVRMLHRHHTRLLTWTVRNENDYNKVKGHVDNIIFEFLDLDTNGNIKQR